MKTHNEIITKKIILIKIEFIYYKKINIKYRKNILKNNKN